jgi:hypothetical protein
VGAYIEWNNQYKYVANQLGFTYTSVYNLTDGLAGYLRGDYDFLGVDAIVAPAQLGPEYLQVPQLGSAMAVVYKISALPANATLRLSREVLARIWYNSPSPANTKFLPPCSGPSMN